MFHKQIQTKHLMFFMLYLKGTSLSLKKLTFYDKYIIYLYALFCYVKHLILFYISYNKPLN